jgi:Beta-ketoacyl synthase, C-terminal domain
MMSVQTACYHWFAGLSPQELAGVVMHGTGTPLGDPIEIGALGEALGSSKGTSHLAIGAVKSCYGHTEGAAGLTGALLAISLLNIAVGLLFPYYEGSHFYDLAMLPGVKVRVWTKSFLYYSMRETLKWTTTMETRGFFNLSCLLRKFRAF